MDLRPVEFEVLQPHEFIALLDGYVWRRERQEDMLAYFTSCMMSVHLVKAISPAELIKPLRGEDATATREEDEAYLREIFKDELLGAK